MNRILDRVMKEYINNKEIKECIDSEYKKQFPDKIETNFLILDDCLINVVPFDLEKAKKEVGTTIIKSARPGSIKGILIKDYDAYKEEKEKIELSTFKK